MTQKRDIIWLMLIILALIAYTAPWVVSAGVSLTFGAFDLAEWASLHPITRPDLLTSLLLRMPLVCLAWILAFNAPERPLYSMQWWIALFGCLLLAIFSSPPLEFLTTNRDDMNYQQQAFLVLMTLVGSGIGLSGIAKNYRGYIAIGAGFLGMLCGLVGMMQGHRLLTEFQIMAYISWGAIGTIIILGLLTIYSYAVQQKRRR